MDLRRALRVDSLLRMVAVAAVVVLANLLAVKHFVRLDLTQDRVHTLSQQSRLILGRLEKPLVVKVYFTAGLETPYNNHQQVLEDKLQEMRAWGRGRVELVTVDPTADEDARAEARSYGIEPIQYRFRSQDRQELKQVWMGAVLLYGERQFVMPAITQVDTIEYDLARAVKQLLSGEERKKVGFLTGHGEPDLLTAKGPLEQLRNRLADSYELVAVDLSAGPVPEDVAALLVVGPQRPLNLAELYDVDQFLMKGKPVGLFLSQLKPDLRTGRAIPVYHGLEALLGHYGIRLNRDLVVDRTANGQMRFPVRQGQYVVQLPVNYPPIPRVTNLSRSSLVVRDLDQMLFPFVSSLTLPDGPGTVQWEALATTGAESGRITNVVRIEPGAFQVRDLAEEQGEFVLLASGEGSFTSFFADRPVPELGVGREASGRIRESAPARLVVGGSADFIANNLTFMENLVDWMAEDAELISIRSKAVQVPALELPEAGTVRWLQLANLLAPAALVGLAGAVRLWLRQRAG